MSGSSHGLGDTTVSEDTPAATDDFLLQLTGAAGFDPDGPTHETFAPFPGEQIARYLLVDKLAQGNFGFIFSARDVELDREVALKVLNPDHANKREIVRRFLQEAIATARVVHPGVVTILDCGRYNGGAYIAMDLLDGESLTARLENCGRFLPHDAVEVARQLAAALEATHAAGVLHRDLKPDNIFVVNDPSMPDGLRIKILDFGLAKVIEETGTSSPRAAGQTRVHSVFGTPRYMSPEQCRSSTTIDHRADIYSLGCILFELVTGSPPFDGDVGEVIEAHLVGNIPRASMLTGCSAHLDELITQLMAKDPDRRPQSMTAVRRALDKLPLGRLGSTPLTPPPRSSPLPAMPVPAAQVRSTSGLGATAASAASATSATSTTSTITTTPKQALPPPAAPSREPRASLPPPVPPAVPSPDAKSRLPPMAIPRIAAHVQPASQPQAQSQPPRAPAPQPAAPKPPVPARATQSPPFTAAPGRLVSPGSSRVPRIVKGVLSVPTAPGVTSLSTGKPVPYPVHSAQAAPRQQHAQQPAPGQRAQQPAPGQRAQQPVPGQRAQPLELELQQRPTQPPPAPHAQEPLPRRNARQPAQQAPHQHAQQPLPPYFPKPPTVAASPYAPTPFSGSPLAQSAGFSPPQQTGFAPPQPTGFPPPQPTGFSPPQQTGFASPQPTEFSPPQQTRFAPPQQTRFAPQQTGFASPQQTRFASPQQTRFAPPQQTGFPPPQQTRFAPPQQTGFASPQQTGFSPPQQTGFASPQPTGFPPPHHIGWPHAVAAVALQNPSPPLFMPSAHAARHVAMAYATSTNPKVPALHVPIAVAVGLPAPSMSTRFGVADYEPPPASRVPLIVLAIACVVSGALAALVLF